MTITEVMSDRQKNAIRKRFKEIIWTDTVYFVSLTLPKGQYRPSESVKDHFGKTVDSLIHRGDLFGYYFREFDAAGRIHFHLLICNYPISDRLRKWKVRDSEGGFVDVSIPESVWRISEWWSKSLLGLDLAATPDCFDIRIKKTTNGELPAHVLDYVLKQGDFSYKSEQKAIPKGEGKTGHCGPLNRKLALRYKAERLRLAQEAAKVAVPCLSPARIEVARPGPSSRFWAELEAVDWIGGAA